MEEANFCSNCGLKITELFSKRAMSELVTAGGILVIISACVGFFSGVVGLAISISGLTSAGYSSSYYMPAYRSLLLVSIFHLVGFGFGLAAGIQSLRGKEFKFVLVGISLLTLMGVSALIVGLIPSGTNILFAVIFGVPIILLSLLGLIFIATKRSEFT